MDYKIHMENFDGPMDLLLHLVKETKLDIYEIQMSEIIESYLNYIQSLQNLNIDIGSEFLLMASSLIHLKSKMLIGKTTEEPDSEDEYSITSEEDLKQKIIEYEKYKNIIKDLQELEEKRSEIYTKLPEHLENYVTAPELENTGLTAEDLLKALNNMQNNMLTIGQTLKIPDNSSNEIYIVRPGDNLWEIARRFNTTVQTLRAINNISSDNLSIGQKLIIPK